MQSALIITQNTVNSGFYASFYSTLAILIYTCRCFWHSIADEVFHSLLDPVIVWLSERRNINVSDGRAQAGDVI